MSLSQGSVLTTVTVLTHASAAQNNAIPLYLYKKAYLDF